MNGNNTLGCAASGQACPCKQPGAAKPAGLSGLLGLPCLGCASGQAARGGRMGDLSFDGTGILGTGLFGYAPWYDSSQWTPVEWAAATAAAIYLWRGVKWGKRTTAARRDRRAKRVRLRKDLDEARQTLKAA